MTTTGTSPMGPCAPAREGVETRCAESERLARAAEEHQQRLRAARAELQELSTLREADARVRDRRQLAAAKDAARDVYHQQMIAATDRTLVQQAVHAWLREVSRLNRQLAYAEQRADALAGRVVELERELPGAELAADAARIAAEAALQECLQARRVLAECEEAAQSRLAPEPAPAPAQAGDVRMISLVLKGDRDELLGLSQHLAEQSGVEPGRLQLLLLEFREAMGARALESGYLSFPADHPFWSQFPDGDDRRVASSLAAMGFRFDGSSGWEDGRVPAIRDLSIALSHAGFDPLAMRRPPAQDAVNELWRGTTVLVESFLADRAPDLELEQVMRSLGPAAGRLAELWDMWGRLRLPLLAYSSA